MSKFMLYHTPLLGTAIIRRGSGGTVVAFSRILVLPFLHTVEYIRTSATLVTITRSGDDGLLCKDGERIDVTAVFTVGVMNTAEDVLLVASMLGSERANDEAQVAAFFYPKFLEALKVAGRRSPV